MADFVSCDRLLQKAYSRFLFLTIQVHRYSILGKRIAKMWLIIAAIQFFRHVYGFILCGNCSVVLVQNISECYCFEELKPCGESLESAGD